MGLTTWLHAHRKKVYHPTLMPPQYLERHAGRPALILGSGGTVREEAPKILDLILDTKPVVFTCNRPSATLGDFPYFPHYTGFINRKRFCSYAKSTHLKTTLLIGPHIPEDTVLAHIDPLGRWERLPFRNVEDPFRIEQGVIACDCGDVGMTLIVVAALMGCSPIQVAGMDGYPDGRPTHCYPEPDWQQSGAIAHQTRVMLILPEVRAWCRAAGIDGPHWLTRTVYRGVYRGFPRRGPCSE